MAKSTETTETPVEEVPKFDYAPMEGGNAILAAWQGLYHIFGARVDNFIVTPEGVFVNGFSVDPKWDAQTIVRDIGGTKGRNRRLELIPLYDWVMGKEPALFNDAPEMTAWLVANFKGSVDESSTKSPAYAREGIALYKKAHNIYKARGPKKRVIRLDQLSDLDESMLLNINLDELRAFKELLTIVEHKKEAQV